MNKSGLIEKISAKTGLHKNACKKVIDSFEEVVSEEITRKARLVVSTVLLTICCVGLGYSATIYYQLHREE